MTPATILVVEDNPITRKMLRVALATEGYTVLEAPDGRTALELMARAVPDLVLQDLLLPDMDGFDLVSQLRALPGGDATPIVACSGFLSRFEATRLTALGFTDFLSKPIEPSRLVRAIHSLLPMRGSGGTLGQDRHVLVADDDPIQLKLTHLHLRQLGFRVTTAADGAEALAQAHRVPPDAILSDVLMPCLDGFELCLAVRQDPRLADIPVVLTSANYLEEADRSLARRVGASALTRRTPDFREAIEALLESFRGRPPRPQGAKGPLKEEHLHRMVRQLERQVVNNAALVQRNSFQAAVLSMLAGLSTSLAERLDFEGAPAGVLESLLDVGGLSVGALYLLGAGGGLELQAQHGYSGDDDQAAASVFGHAELLDEAFRAGGPLAIPSAAVPPPTADDFLGRARVKSALLVPIGSPGEPMGLLFLGSKRRDLCDSDWHLFAQTVGDQISQTLARSRAFSRLVAAEERYRALFENAVEGIFRASPDGRPTLANPALARILGYGSRDEMVAAVTDIIGRLCVEPERAVELRRQIAAQGVGPGFEIDSHREDGRPLWLSLSARVVRDARGVHLEGRVEDITARKRAEEVQERLVAILEATTDFVGMADPSGRVLYVNRAGRQMLGLAEAEDLARTTIPDYSPAWATRLILEQGIPAATRDGAWRGETALITRDGRELPVSQVIIAHRSAGGTVEFLSTIAHDLSERKRAEEALRQSEKLAALGELLAGVAHELNNPLAVVLGQTELLRHTVGEGPLGARAAKIGQAAERCARIVWNFLALARQQPSERAEVRLNTVVQEAVELLTYPLRVDNMEVRLNLAADLPSLWADPHQLHQALINLVSNAHHVMRGAPPPHVVTLTTRFDVARRRVVLEVADTGPGIPPEIQARIFEPFFTTKPLGQGTGLGLSLCHGIVEAHGGTIRVNGRPGQGAIFRIELPVTAVPARVTEDAEAEAALPLSRGTILVVDDEQPMVDMLVETLSLDGHRVEGAANGVAALEKLGSGAYDLIVSDLRMPELDGPGLYREIERRYPQLRRRVVFLTGDSLSPDTASFLEATRAPTVSKPFSPWEVLRVVRHVLRRPEPASRPDDP